MITAITTTTGPGGIVTARVPAHYADKRTRSIQTDHGPRHVQAAVRRVIAVDDNPFGQAHADALASFINVYFPRTGGGCWLGAAITAKQIAWLHVNGAIPSRTSTDRPQLTGTLASGLVLWT